MSHGKCSKCSKTVYLQEGFKVGPPGKEVAFHKGCFKCSNPGCTWQLNLTNYKFCDGKAFCANHNPMTGFSNSTVKVSGNTSIEDKGMQMVTQGPKLDNMKSNVLVSGDTKHSSVESLETSHVKNAPRQGVNNNQNVRSVSSNSSGVESLLNSHVKNAPRQGVNNNQNVRSVSSNSSGVESLLNSHVKNAPRQGVNNNQNVRSVTTNSSGSLDLSSQHALNVPKIGVNNNQTVRVENQNKNVDVVNKTEEIVQTPIEVKSEVKSEVKTEVKKEKVEPTGKIECQQGKRWNVENFKGRNDLKLDSVERGQVVYLYNLQDCVVEVTCEKFASISVDKVVRTGIKFTKSIGSLEVVNSTKVQIQGSAPSYNIDKSDSITLFLGPEDLESQVISSKAEINIVVLEGDEPVETPIPSQFVTTFDTKSNKWITAPSGHVGA